MVSLCLLAAIYFATIFFGGAHLWAQSVIILSVLGFTLAISWRWLLHNARTQPSQVILDPPSIVGIFFVISVGMQVIPLKPGILQVLSPKTYTIWQSTHIVGGSPPFPLSLYPYITINSLVFAITLLVFYWLALYGLKRRSQIHLVILGLLVLGAVESLYALGQLVTGGHYCLWWEKAFSENVATGTFIDRNHLAGFLSMLICLGVGYIWALGHEEKNNPAQGKRTLYTIIEQWSGYFGTRGIIVLLSLAIMIAALLSTASRGGALTLLAGLIFMTGLIFARFFKTRKAFILGLMLSAVFMYVGYVAGDRVMERFKHFGPGLESRLAFTRATYKMGKDFPLTGAGLGTFEFVFPHYQDFDVDALVDYAHNDWMQLFAEGGCVGFFIIGAGIIWFMYISIARWRKRRDPFSVGIGLGGMGAMVAISIHSLSEFNLHMPANAFLFVLIVAIIYLVLHSRRHRGGEVFTYPRYVLRVSVWIGVVIIIIATFFGGVIGKRVVQNWRADSIARTFWNSTIPFVEPTDEELKKAWRLSPGNATYWSWMAQRAFSHPDRPFDILDGEQGGAKDADIYLLSEGIKRNPADWRIWHQLGWGSLLKSGKDPDYYLPLAWKALDRACWLRPYVAQGHFESGIAGLAAYIHHTKGASESSWKEAFRKALALKPALAQKVADQLVLYLGNDGAKEIKALLPDDPQSYRFVAGYLLRQGYLDAGIDILRQGEIKRKQRIEDLWDQWYESQSKLWTLKRSKKSGIEPVSSRPAKWTRRRIEYRGDGRMSKEEREKIITQILSLDPGHPGALLERGKVLGALKSQERRTGNLKKLNQLRSAAWFLHALNRAREDSPVEAAYFLGRMAEEEGDLIEARALFERALTLNRQYFPAWIHLRKILLRTANIAGDRGLLESLDKKIKMFEMDKVVASAWRWAGDYEGLPSWKASFRFAKAKKGLDVNCYSSPQGVWLLLADGCFVNAWAGGGYHERKDISIPAGEHEFRLVYYGDVLKKEKRLPLELEVIFLNPRIPVMY